MLCKEPLNDEIKLVERNLVYDGTSHRVYADTMEFPDGVREIWDLFEHKFDASAVLPVLPNGDIILVDQLRPAHGKHTWEIPAGKKDDFGKEDPLVCAKRELLEETGYTSDDFSLLFNFRPTPTSTEEIAVYIARNIYVGGSQNLDEGEIINTRAFKVNEIKAMIKNGEIEDGKTIAAVFSLG